MAFIDLETAFFKPSLALLEGKAPGRVRILGPAPSSCVVLLASTGWEVEVLESIDGLENTQIILLSSAFEHQEKEQVQQFFQDIFPRVNKECRMHCFFPPSFISPYLIAHSQNQHLEKLRLILRTRQGVIVYPLFSNREIYQLFPDPKKVKLITQTTGFRRVLWHP